MNKGPFPAETAVISTSERYKGNFFTFYENKLSAHGWDFPCIAIEEQVSKHTFSH